MLIKKRNYLFGPTLDVIFLITLTVLTIYLFKANQQLSQHENTLNKMLPFSHLHEVNSVYKKVSFTTNKNIRTPSSISFGIIREINGLSNIAHSYAIIGSACLLLTLVAVTFYNTKQHLNYRLPSKKIIKNIAVATGQSEDDKKTVEELVDQLLQSRKSSQEFVKEIAEGNIDVQADFKKEDALVSSLLMMQEKLKLVSANEKQYIWINEGLTTLETLLKSESDYSQLVKKVTGFLTKQSGATVGAFYEYENLDNGYFNLVDAYGYFTDANTKRKIEAGHGQLGEVALQKHTIQLNDIPEKYIAIHSGLGSSYATHITIIPFLFKEKVYGALELASFNELGQQQIQWLEKCGESIGAYLFNKTMHETTKKRLEFLAEQQAAELEQIHKLQRETNQRLQAKLQEAEEEKTKNEAILEGCVDGVISFNEAGKIMFTNNAIRQMLELDCSTVLNATVYDLLPVDIETNQQETKVYYIHGSNRKEISVRTESCFRTRGGDSVDVLVTSTQAKIHNATLFTFFVQKISVDLF